MTLSANTHDESRDENFDHTNPNNTSTTIEPKKHEIMITAFSPFVSGVNAGLINSCIKPRYQYSNVETGVSCATKRRRPEMPDTMT
mmetsp:Transcript_46360/g.63120  ORF Transcript_46360/g.63120 Transcript_46360/m.63120 type:complete len:86 (-) Transcript_46360:468-725(-)